MGTPQRLGGGRLAVRLFLLVLIPVVAVGGLAVDKVMGERAAAIDADRFAQAIEVHQAVGAAYAPVQVERLAVQGAALAAEVGLDVDDVGALIGLDVVSLRDANEVAFGAAFDGLVDELGVVAAHDPESTSAMLRSDLIAVGIDLETLAARADGDADEVTRLFDRLDATLAAIEHDTIDTALDLGQAPVDVDRLIAVGQVLASASRVTTALLTSITTPSADTGLAAVKAGGVHRAELDNLRASLPASQRPELDRLAAAFNEPNLTALNSLDGSTDPVVLREVGSMIAAQHSYLTGLARFSADIDDSLVVSARAAADQHRTRMWQAGALAVAIGVVTVASMLFVVWSTVGPLRRLSRRAAEIQEGRLAVEPLPVVGPSDIRELTHTWNDMLGTLQKVDDQVSLIARGDPAAAAAATDLPGAIGVSLRDSMQRLSDVTERLQRSERLASSIVAQAADAIWTIDGHGRVLSANDASSLITEVPGSEQVGEHIDRFVSTLRGDGVVTSVHGHTTPVLVNSSAISGGDDPVTAVIAHDIAERARYEAELAYQAHHDVLTGLPNRAAVFGHLDTVTADPGHRVAVLFLDLDGFKNVNDSRGHAAGDQLLAEVARRLARRVGDGDFVARLGGDEFLIVREEFSSTEMIVDYGYSLIRAIEEPYHDGSHTFLLSASIGVAFSGPGLTVHDTIRHADNAVYLAKRRGRNRVEVFDAEMQSAVEREAELEMALRNAVRSGELVVHLQPMLDVVSGRFTGAEALVRWRRPGFGLVPPGDFIPIAERSSLINDLERWMLRQTCERLAMWRERDPHCDFRVGVNISGQHLVDGNLVGDVNAALALSGADPSMLELELTETQLLSDLDRATEALNHLRAKGIQIAVDDFGTGYSSLTYLRHLPVDTMKIDRSFINSAADSHYDAAVVAAAITIGRTLSLDVVAEGIETAHQLDYVREIGCNRAQGYLLARPMDVAAAEQILFTGRHSSLTFGS